MVDEAGQENLVNGVLCRWCRVRCREAPGCSRHDAEFCSLLSEATDARGLPRLPRKEDGQVEDADNGIVALRNADCPEQKTEIVSQLARHRSSTRAYVKMSKSTESTNTTPSD